MLLATRVLLTIPIVRGQFRLQLKQADPEDRDPEDQDLEDRDPEDRGVAYDIHARARQRTEMGAQLLHGSTKQSHGTILSFPQT